MQNGEARYTKASLRVCGHFSFRLWTARQLVYTNHVVHRRSVGYNAALSPPCTVRGWSREEPAPLLGGGPQERPQQTLVIGSQGGIKRIQFLSS